MTEKWDVYDLHRRRTGLTRRNDEPAQAGEFRLIISVILFDARGRMLIQKRTDDKSQWPGLWDLSVGGKAQAGETSQQAAMREINEEMGIAVDLEFVAPAFTFTFPGGFDDFYIAAWDGALDQLTVPNEEVAEVAWVTAGDVEAIRRRGDFLPYRKEVLQLAFAMRTADSALEPKKEQHHRDEADGQDDDDSDF